MNKLYILPTNTCFGIACPVDKKESYEKIYEIKGRDFNKPLALICENFKYLEDNTDLNKKQIDFLKNYKKPFTILLDIEKIRNKNILENIKKLHNKELYKKLAFRVAHSFMQVRLIQDNGILFLTSANKSGQAEIFDTKTIKEKLSKQIEKYDINIFAHPEYKINSTQKSSDIFEFIGEDLEIKYLRKN